MPVFIPNVIRFYLRFGKGKHVHSTIYCLAPRICPRTIPGFDVWVTLLFYLEKTILNLHFGVLFLCSKWLCVDGVISGRFLSCVCKGTRIEFLASDVWFLMIIKMCNNLCVNVCSRKNIFNCNNIVKYEIRQ